MKHSKHTRLAQDKPTFKKKQKKKKPNTNTIPHHTCAAHDAHDKLILKVRSLQIRQTRRSCCVQPETSQGYKCELRLRRLPVLLQPAQAGTAMHSSWLTSCDIHCGSTNPLCICQLTHAAQPASGFAMHLGFACARLSQAICFVQAVQLMPSHHWQISFVATGVTSTTMPKIHAAEQTPVQQLQAHICSQQPAYFVPEHSNKG